MNERSSSYSIRCRWETITNMARYMYCDKCLCCFTVRKASLITSAATLMFSLFICIVSGLIIRMDGRLENLDVKEDFWPILSDPYVATVIVYGFWSVAAFLGLVGSIQDVRSMLLMFFTMTVLVLVCHLAAYVALFATHKFGAYFFTPLHSTIFVFGVIIIIFEVYGLVFVMKHVKLVIREFKLNQTARASPEMQPNLYFAGDMKQRGRDGVRVDCPVYDEHNLGTL